MFNARGCLPVLLMFAVAPSVLHLAASNLTKGTVPPGTALLICAVAALTIVFISKRHIAQLTPAWSVCDKCSSHGCADCAGFGGKWTGAVIRQSETYREEREGMCPDHWVPNWGNKGIGQCRKCGSTLLPRMTSYTVRRQLIYGITACGDHAHTRVREDGSTEWIRKSPCGKCAGTGRLRVN